MFICLPFPLEQAQNLPMPINYFQTMQIFVQQNKAIFEIV